MRIRRARASDVEAIHQLISNSAGAGALLPRTEEEIRRAVPDFLVAVAHGRVAGCAAVEGYGGALAEIRSLVVADDARGSGLGAKLLHAITKHARRRGIARLLAVTSAGELFERNGFARVPGGMPAEKIARDCAQCPKAASCGLVALALDLTPSPAPVGALPILQPSGLARIPRTVPA